jgi:hypothetical protein
MIVLRPNSQGGLKIQRALKRLQSKIDGAETCTGCGKPIMNMRRFGLALQRTLKHLLGSYVFAAIKLDYTTII